MPSKLRRKLLGGLGLCLCVLIFAALFFPGRTAPVFARMPEATLVIDPGHGGEDGGAVSGSGVAESGVNLEIALRLDQLMGFYGVRTLLTRTEDVSIHDRSAGTLREKKVSDLHNRVALVNRTANATLLSIHQNASPAAKYHGAQVFYAGDGNSMALAESLQNALRRLDRENARAPQPIPATVYLMGHVLCRAVLVECGFLSNPEEASLLQSPDYQKKLAVVLGGGYLTNEGE